MQLRLLLLIFVLATVVHEGNSSFVSSKWTNLFKSFFGKNIPAVKDHDSPLDAKDARIKRSIFASLGAAINCEPGYTGRFCESPICRNPTSVPPTIMQYANRAIDQVVLRQNCAPGFHTFPLDAECITLFMFIKTDYGTPIISLINDQGQVIPVNGLDGIKNGEYYYYSWSESPKPGLYQLNISTDDPGNNHFCELVVATQTQLDIDVGFVDRPQDDTFIPGIAYSVPQYIVVHPHYLEKPGTINAVYLYENERDHTRYAMQLQPRYGCGYEYYAGEFTCTPGNKYRWVVEGVDKYGYLWRRSSDVFDELSRGSFDCIPKPTLEPPVTPTPQRQNVTFCMNFGTLLTGQDGYNYCICTEFWSGQTCESAMCMNGGTPTKDRQVCDCPPPYYGSNCQHVQCYNNPDREYFSDTKTLIFVFHNSPTIMAQMPFIIRDLNLTYYGYFSMDRVWSKFILVTYGANLAPDSNSYDNFDTFLTTLSALSSSSHRQEDLNCTDNGIAALSQIFLVHPEDIRPRSPIFFLTDVAPSDTNDWRNFMEMNLWRNSPLYTFFYTDPGNPCQTDTLSEAYRTLQDASLLTGGLIFTPNNNSYANTFKQVMQRVSYQANVVTMNEMYKCSFSGQVSFIVDAEAEFLTIMATGTNLSLKLTDPDWNVTTNDQFIDPLPGDQNNFIWDVEYIKPGEWLYFIQATGGGTNAPCSVRVFVRSRNDLYIGASLGGISDDGDLPNPLQNYTSYMVATMEGFGARTIDPFRLFAEMQIESWNWNAMANRPVYYSSGIYRDGCTFKLSFGGFTCTEADQRYIVTVFADDEFGFPIQRTTTAYCVGSVQTTIPPNGQCWNGGAQNPTNTSQCICPPDWSGDNCTIPVCYNNGTLVNGICKCPSMVYGDHCQWLGCQSPNPAAAIDFNNKGLGLVFDLRQTMANSIQDIVWRANEFVRDVNNVDPFWVSNYVVGWFSAVSMGTYNSPIPAWDINRFYDALRVMENDANHTYTTPDNCTGFIVAALSETIAMVSQYPNSQVFVFADSDFPSDTLTNNAINYISALQMALDNRVTVNFVITSYALCGAPNGGANGPSQAMQYFASETGGQIYYTTHAGKFLKVIPTYHMSSLIAGRQSSDCKGSPITYWLPVDYWSQSFVVSAMGPGVQITVTPPPTIDPAKNIAYYEVQLDQDDYLNVKQYIVYCADMSWKDLNDYCYLNSYQINGLDRANATLGWYDARDACHRLVQAYLVDILHNSTQKFINDQIGPQETWIGLYRQPNTSNFYWDNIVFTNLTYDPNNSRTWHSWAPHEPSAPGSGKDCVYLKGGLWYTDDCTKTRYFMCQTSRYGQPRDMSSDDNRLPAGNWKLSITTPNNSWCMFEARIQSPLQVNYGYSIDMHTDFPNKTATVTSNQNRLIVHANSLAPLNPDNFYSKVNGHLNYAMIYDQNYTLISTVTFQERYPELCHYEYISQTFACPGYPRSTAKTPIFITFSGIDQKGNLFERYAASYCTALYCAHGWASNGQCICEPYWTGKSCDIPICLNRGTARQDGTCACISDRYQGAHCELPICEHKTAANFNDTGITLAIMLETSAKTQMTSLYLKWNLEKILRNVTQDGVTSSNWISNYIFYPYDSESNQAYWWQPVYTTNPADITARLNEIQAGKCPGPNNQTGTCEAKDQCPRPVFRVLQNVLNNITQPNSIVLIFATASASDHNLLTDVHDLAMSKRTIINVILPDQASFCGNYQYNDTSVLPMFQIAQFTGGDFFFTLSRQIVSSLLPFYLPTLYRYGNLGSTITNDCAGETVYVPVDKNALSLSVSYSAPTSGQVQLTVTDALGNTATTPYEYRLYDYTYYGYFNFSELKLVTGTWKVQVQASNANWCVLNVRVRSKLEVFAAFADASNQRGEYLDIVDPIPSADRRNAIVLHANNLGTGAINYVQLYGSRGDQVIFTSEVKKRQDCSYDWWATDSFECVYGVYVLGVFGVDSNNQQFVRHLAYECFSTRPPPQPYPPGKCDLYETIPYDILLIIDVTAKGNQTDFGNLKSALSRTFSGFAPDNKFSMTRNRMSIIGVGNEQNTKVLYTFNDSEGKTPDDLLVDVKQLRYANGTGYDYNLQLSKAIELARAMPTDANSGYRNYTMNSGRVRHIAIYATLNGALNGDDPADAIRAMIRSGSSFGFGLIGWANTYYDDAWRKNLETLAIWPCAYYDVYGGPQYMPWYFQDLACHTARCGDAAANETAVLAQKPLPFYYHDYINAVYGDAYAVAHL